MQDNIKVTYIQEDEIDLKELFKSIWAKKRFIFIFTAFITILAIVYVFIKTPIYQVKSNIQIGYIGENLLDEPSTIVKKLELIFDVLEEIEKKDEDFISKVSAISQNKKLNNFIEVRTDAISNEEALNLNKKVLSYLKNEYENKINQYITDTKNTIKRKTLSIANIDNYEIKNIQEQIKILKEQKIVNIDTKISLLKNTKLKSIDKKLQFYQKKLKEYEKTISNIYTNSLKLKDTTTSSISAIQLLNYQNLILNSQNKIEDLKIDKETIQTQTIPKLLKEKENIVNSDIRKLQYKIDVTLKNKKENIKQEIEKLKYNISNLNIQNSRVVGQYILKENPVKPKKKLLLIASFVTGFIISIFLVFFINLIKEKD